MGPDDVVVHDGAANPRCLSIVEAAKYCEVSPKTIMRRMKAGEFPNAFRCPPTQATSYEVPKGAWLIPETDLDEMTVRGRPVHAVTPDPEPVEAPGEAPGPEPVEVVATELDAAIKAEIDEWKRKAGELDVALRRAEVAEAVAAERERQITSLEGSLKALESSQAELTAALAMLRAGELVHQREAIAVTSTSSTTTGPNDTGARPARWWRRRTQS